jgi:solute carrier family 25 (mitochondrial dicarboxylate transporter), member 10
VYEYIKGRISEKKKPGTIQLIGISAGAGFLGGMAGNPADVLNVRMQHDAALPAAERRKYKHAFDGLIRMVREEGPASIWRGIWPNSMRAALMTASQLASYDTFKAMILKSTSLEDGLLTYFLASTMAGFVATTICSPVDVIKTRIMSATEKQGIMELLATTFKNEGAAWMFRGWVPSFIRLGPQTVATFLFLEQHKKIYRGLKGLE